MHPSSVVRETMQASTSMHKAHANLVSKLPVDWLIFDELSRNGTFCLARGITLVTALTVSFIPTFI